MRQTHVFKLCSEVYVTSTEKKTGKKAVRFGLMYKFSIAMILLTLSVIFSMAFYMLRMGSRIVRENIISQAQIQMDSFANVVQTNLGNDELNIISGIQKIKKTEAFLYAHVYDRNLVVVNSSEENTIGSTNTDADIAAFFASDAKDVSWTQKEDPTSPENSIFDFMLVIYNQFTGEKAALIRLGFSDKAIHEQARIIRNAIVLLIVIFGAAAVVAATILSFLTTNPLKRLSEGVSVISTGNLDHKIVVNSHDEIEALAEEFNLMTDQLKNSKEKEIEGRIMQEQLDVAKEIQEGLNPMGFYNKNGIQIKGYTKAAKGVGGDYFDYIEIDEHHIGALISDVSGKGIPASLVMVMIRTVFVSAIRQDPKFIQCKNIVASINDALSAEFAIDKFATLFFMIYDSQTQTVSFSNAGHGPLFCYRANKGVCTVTKIDGMPIGVMEESEYVQARVPFYPGDIIIMNTDGVTEMRNPDKDEYGLKRLQNMIIRHHKKNAEEIVKIIVDDLETFRSTAPPHDDTTLVVFKRVS